MVNKQRVAMGITGAMGFALFLIANFTALFEGSSVAAGLLQISVNTAVFWTWGINFLNTKGREKLFSFGGVVIPIIMASITIYRVLIPALLEALK